MAYRWIGCISMMFFLALAGGCQLNPATGQRNLNFIGESQEISMGLQAQPEFIQSYGGELPAPAVHAYVVNLGRRLAAQSERASLPWEFHVVDSSVLNAFALPGGKVFISRGLLAQLSSEAELAGVLGHEIGHVTAQHIGQRMSQALVLTGIQTGIGVAADVKDSDWLRALGVGTQVGGTLYLLKFSRDEESQADELGVRYMARLGYNPMAQIRVMEVLRQADGGSGQLEILSTHPAPQTRIDRLEQHIQKNYPEAESGARYQYRTEEFKVAVLEPLAKLPPAKHTGDKQ